MRTRRSVVVHNRAARDIANFAVAIARSVSVASARTWRERIETTVRDLSDDADQWPEADEAAVLGINLRYRLSGRHRHVYRILFTIEDDVVYVHRIRHAAQDRLSPDDV